jgi:ATP synthase protein I
MDPERPLKPEHGSENPQPDSAGAGALAGMGLQFALSILLFLLIGQWIDRKLGTAPLFLIVFVFTGAGASFYSIYRKVVEQQRRDDEQRHKK